MERDPRLEVGRRVHETRPAVDAASIVLVRDGADGLEVLMLERHIETDFAGGALVFPGGKVDAADTVLPPAQWQGIEPGSVVDTLGAADAPSALGLHVAAVREAFEEAGVLFGTRGGAPLVAADLDTPAFATARRRMTDRSQVWDWTPWLVEQDVVLDLGALAFLAWWVTPDGLHRRYDTRFFVAAVPEGQGEAIGHDDVETTASRWVRPADALDAAAKGRAVVVYPTRKLLESFREHPSAGALLDAAAHGRTDRRRLQPEIVEVDGRPMVRHPDGGDPEPG